jgi:adenylate cyclase
MKQLSGARKKKIRNLPLVVLLVLLVLLLSLTGWLGYLDGRLFDYLVTSIHPEPEHRDDIVIACIDQTSISYYAEKSSVSWPWPRLFYAQLLRYLASCGARAVVFDIIFSETDVDRTNEVGDESDRMFADAITTTGIAFLAVSDRNDSIAVENTYSWGLTESGIFSRCNKIQSYRYPLLPYTLFLEGKPGLGFVNMQPDEDGIHRRYPLVSRSGGTLVPSMAMAVAERLMDADSYRSKVLEPLSRNSLLDNEGKILINWYGMGGVDPMGKKDLVFTYYSFHAIITSSLQVEQGEEPVIPKSAFRDKIVIVGSNAAGLLDLKTTPFTQQNLYPGLEIHATALENLLSGDFMYRTPGWIVYILIIAAAAGLFLSDRLFRSLRVFITAYILMVALIIGVAYLLILRNIFFPGSGVLLSASLVFVGLIISGYFSESKDKRLLRRQFERYVNDTVLDEILANPNAVDVKGRTVNATVMATDIANFTGISEQLPPHEVVSRLNSYLSEVSEALIDHRAFINKYIGDAILAIYGAFGEADHQKNACRAALHAAAIIRHQVQKALEENSSPFETRFGVTTGEITLGNIGSARKTEYTVIGDTVNSAFRLEGLNKFYRTTILVSEHTRDAAVDEFEFRLIDTLRYKGKVTPVKIYELVGIRGEVSEEALRRRNAFERALEIYSSGAFAEARNLFSALADETDAPSAVFRDRCDKFIQEPPPADWNGVWIMQRK